MTLLTYLQLLRYSILGSQLSVHWSMQNVFKFNTQLLLGTNEHNLLSPGECPWITHFRKWDQLLVGLLARREFK